MKPSQGSDRILRKLFRKRQVVTLDELMATLGTSSRMTVFRRLKMLGYLSSFTDAGKYYTLTGIPVFDEFGLWFYNEIGFSSAGTLKSTIAEIVETSKAGMTPKGLLDLMKLKIPNSLHNTLRDLIKAGFIQRQIVDGKHLYLSRHPEKSKAQIQRFRSSAVRAIPAGSEPSSETIIAVLVEALRAEDSLVSPKTVSSRLNASGLQVSVDQVTMIYGRYGLNAQKKTTERP